MPTVTIDGRSITVDRGATVLQAAQRLGIEIPTFCYHPGLTIAANCRMCLVQVEKAPKPLPACQTEVRDGMVVRTDTEQVRDDQRAVLEFILLNHPVDCPICDQAGECVLQDHYYAHDRRPSRLFTRKVHKAKAKVLGPTVVLDAERCVLCTRCVRFCAEVTGTHELKVTQRGEHSEITTWPGTELANPYSLNVVDICPVGALTSRDFRFRRRVWMLRGTRSVCTECARGCNVRIDSHRNHLERQVPLYHPKVNRWWMCDEGRLALRRWQADQVRQARVRGQDASTRQAATTMAEALRDAAPRAAIVVSPTLTNEAIWLTLQLADTLGARLFRGGRTLQGEQDTLLRRADRNPNSRGLDALLGERTAPGLERLLGAVSDGQIDAVLVMGAEHAWPEGWQRALRRATTIGVVAAVTSPLTELADVVVPEAMPAMLDGTVVNFEGRVQRLRRAIRLDPPGVVYPAWRIVKHMLGVVGEPVDHDGEASVFATIAAQVAAFAGLDFEALGDYGRMLGSGGEPDVDPDEARLSIDRCAPQWRSRNINSRLPWQH